MLSSSMELIPLCFLAVYYFLSSLGFPLFPLSCFSISHLFPPLSSFPARAYFQMARNKRKATATVPRRQDHLHTPI
jgi:hypothetical protein